METYTPWDIGEIQLNAAIDAYLRRDYIVALTLTYAAEEQYGGPFAPPSELSNEKRLADDRRARAGDARALIALHRLLFKEELKDLWPIINDTKNCVKHYQTPRQILRRE